MFEFEGRTALVTGASSGIGAALAEDLARRGMRVAMCARRADRLDEVLARCREHSPESQSWTVDLSDLDGVQDFALRVDDEFGGIDLLVNNAGIPKRKLAVDLRLDEVDDVMAINYLSPVRLILALLPRMLERATTERPAAIATIGSVAARMAPPSETAYSASKAAITAFCEGLAAEVWDRPIGVHVLHPGIVDTELFSQPDNDESIADDVEALPPSAVCEALAEQLQSGRFETYVPDWFNDIASGKFGDVQGFLSSVAEYFTVKQQADGA